MLQRQQQKKSLNNWKKLLEILFTYNSFPKNALENVVFDRLITLEFPYLRCVGTLHISSREYTE